MLRHSSQVELFPNCLFLPYIHIYLLEDLPKITTAVFKQWPRGRDLGVHYPRSKILMAAPSRLLNMRETSCKIA